MPGKRQVRSVADRTATRRRRQADAGPGKTVIYAPPLTISRREFIANGGDDAFRESIFQLVSALDRLMSCRDLFGRYVGLTGSQFAVLMGVAYRQKATGISVRDLTAHVRLAQPHVTTEIGRLLGKGLLTKVSNPRDRRGVLVSLSSRGERTVDYVVPLVRKVNDMLFAGIGKAELNVATGVMRRLARNADSAVPQLRGEVFRRVSTRGEPQRASRLRAGGVRTP
jgi:DNA-binding MarR family transcriptional regulator